MRWLLGLLMFLGFLLAGSEGELFPWPNLAGAGLLLLFAALTGRKERKG